MLDSLRQLLLIVPAFVPLAAGAQGRPDSTKVDSAAQRLKAVTISATRAVGVVGGTSAVMIEPVQLRSSPAPVLEQALRESPFVHVRQNSRGEMELSVRGSDSRQAAVLIDGVPITLGWDHRADPSLVPITGGERLVIVRGLGSVLSGPNTLGGSIEVTHDARRPVRSQVWAGVEVDEYSSLVATLGGARPLAEFGGGTLSIRGGLAYRQRDGLALPSGAVDPTAHDGLRTNTDLRESDGFASVRWSTPLGRSLGFTVSAFDAEKGVPPEEHLSAPRLWRYPYNRRSLTALSASTGSFSTPWGYGSLDVGVGFNNGKLKIETYDGRDYDTVTGVELGDERTMTARALLSHSVGSATVRAGLTTGDVQYEETLASAAAADYRQKLRSAGVEFDAPIGDRTRLASGVVFDRSSTPETGGRAAQAPFSNPGWRVGITHDVDPVWRFHVSANERSRFPSLRELYSGALNRFTPNPDLKPETLLGLEAGVTMDRQLGSSTHASLQVTGFRHRLEDAVVRITLTNPTRFMRVNRDRIESNGLELLGGVVFGTSPQRLVTLNGDATLQSIRIFDATANDAERHSENNPETRGRLELGLPLPWQVRGVATARYTGTQYCLNGETGNEMTLSGKSTTDLAAERTFTVNGGGPFQWLRTLIALDNVGNAAVYDQCGLPQPGRTLRLTISLR